MADFIYHVIGSFITVFATYVLSFHSSAVRSIEWLNLYASRRMMPPSKRVGFDSIGLWAASGSVTSTWLVLGVFIVPGWPIVVVCVLNFLANYWLSDLSGAVRIRLTIIKSWLLVVAMAAICLGHFYKSLHE